MMGEEQRAQGAQKGSLVDDSEYQAPGEGQVRIVLYLPRDLVRMLKAIAKKQGTTLGFVISVLLSRGAKASLRRGRSRAQAAESENMAGKSIESLSNMEWDG